LLWRHVDLSSNSKNRGAGAKKAAAYFVFANESLRGTTFGGEFSAAQPDN
jgi:hypothetical protein